MLRLFEGVMHEVTSKSIALPLSYISLHRPKGYCSWQLKELTRSSEHAEAI